jgi:hypothetical protein
LTAIHHVLVSWSTLLAGPRPVQNPVVVAQPIPQLAAMRRHAAAIALMTSTLVTQFPYSNPELGFTMTVPAGFLGEGEDLLAPRTTVACFIALPVANQRGWVRLCVERRGGSLPRGAREMPFTWKGLKLEGASFRSEFRDTDVEVFAALVPLRTEPVWLVAMAPIADRAHAQAALVSALSTLQAETGQLSSTERASRAGETVGRIGAIIFAIGMGMWIMKRRQQKASKS